MRTKAKLANVVGRYAPSPTGDLHLGNLRTALVAWLHARSQGGTFLMRMEDIDTPRVVAGSDKKILDDLEWLGLDWDGPVIYQSHRSEFYRQALDQLSLNDSTYQCFCSRKDIREASSAPHVTPGVYPGTCAQLTPEEIATRTQLKSPAIRVRVSEQLQKECGDFVVHRADGLYAYQLAVVVDDLAQGITDVVRGNDLLGSTPRQLFLASLLSDGAPKLRYHHVPLMMDEAGERMSKRDGSFSAQNWRDQGGTAESLLAMFANSMGLLKNAAAINSSELLALVQGHNLEDLFGGY